ncbi:MAG: hypothetical protein DPW09_17240 [Anaerolineae bacterium]|nr:hypothetical protein [Anaerolineae bacterium]
MANLRASNGTIPVELQTRLNDRDVQRALGFLTGFARQFGRQLD